MFLVARGSDGSSGLGLGCTLCGRGAFLLLLLLLLLSLSLLLLLVRRCRGRGRWRGIRRHGCFTLRAENRRSGGDSWTLLG